MKLSIVRPTRQQHDQLVAAVGWSADNDLYSCGDDQSIQRWNSSGEAHGKVCELSAATTRIQWFPAASRKQAGAGGDVFAVACTDGSLKILCQSGKQDKSIEAHRGAVLALRWARDGSALASGGEDGQVKVWSRQGALRYTVAQADSPVYALAWAASGEQLLYSWGPNVAVRALHSNKVIIWTAHAGVVLAVDWSAACDRIVTGGEDFVYKVWDSQGQLLLQSRPLAGSVTSLAWHPAGDAFAVGSVSALLLADADALGVVHSQVRTDAGSLLDLAWCADGTQLAAAGSKGVVVFARRIGAALEDGHLQVEQVAPQRVHVTDLLHESREELEFGGPVSAMALGHGRLVVAASNQVHIYSAPNWNTPHVSDLQDGVAAVLLCARCFLLIQPAEGLNIFTWEGRHLCSPKAAGLPEALAPRLVSLSPDTLAVLEAPSCCRVRFFDTAQHGEPAPRASVGFHWTQGRPLGEPYQHATRINHIVLSQAGTASARQLLVLDDVGDLHVVHVATHRATHLAARVESAAWHSTAPMVVAVAGLQLTIWYHPAAIWVDPQLSARSRYTRNDTQLGQRAQLVSFTGSRCSARRADGALVSVAVPPHPGVVHELAHGGHWDKAVRLCRAADDAALWALLAAVALEAQQCAPAEAAFAALNLPDRLAWVRALQRIPSAEGRAAEMAAFRRQPAEAEAILLRAGLVYRAIKLHVRLCNWERALELAQAHGQHVDTVLLHRRRHLAVAGLLEGLPQFRAAGAAVEVNEVAIQRRVAAEKAAEKHQSVPVVGVAVR